MATRLGRSLATRSHGMTPTSAPTRLCAGAIVLVIVLMGWTGLASATPKLITTVPPGGTATIAPVSAPGEFLGKLCGFSPLSPVTYSVVSVSGSAASEGSQIADQSGCVTFDGRVVGHRLSVNGSAPAPIGYGINDVIGTGNSSSKAHVYDTLRIPIRQGGATGLLGSRASNIAGIMAVVVGSFCGLALLYLLITFARHRMSDRVRPVGPTG